MTCWSYSALMTERETSSAKTSSIPQALAGEGSTSAAAVAIPLRTLGKARLQPVERTQDLAAISGELNPSGET